MKRKAEDEGPDGPAKLTKPSSLVSPERQSSGRQKKVPAWMSSFVVGGGKAEAAAIKQASPPVKKTSDKKSNKKGPCS